MTFLRPDNSEMVTHRIVSVTADTPTSVVVQTKGDANGAIDPWKARLTGQGWREIFAVPALGFLFSYAQSPIGRLLLIVGPGLTLGLIYLVEFWRPTKRGPPGEALAPVR